MRNYSVFVRFGDQVQTVLVNAFGENDAVAKVAHQNLGGVIFAVRDTAYSTLPV